MGKFGGLLDSGRDIARASYRQGSKEKKRDNQKESSYNNELIGRSSEDRTKEQQEEAFLHLQQYADFQHDLSLEPIEDITPGEDLRQGSFFGLPTMTYPSPQHFEPLDHPPQSLQTPYVNRLKFPVVVRQQRYETGGIHWARSYSPALLDFGITQSDFFDFLNSFSEASKFSKEIGTVNLRALGFQFAIGFPSPLEPDAISKAVQIAKSSQSLKKSSFLTKMNSEYFAPRGLFAFVMSFRPDHESQSHMVNVLQQSKRRSEPQNWHTPVYEIELTDVAAMVQDNPESSAWQPNIDHGILNGSGIGQKDQIQHSYAPNSLLSNPPPQIERPWVKKKRPLAHSLAAAVSRKGSYTGTKEPRTKSPRLKIDFSKPPLDQKTGQWPFSQPRKESDLKTSSSSISICSNTIYLVLVNDTKDAPYLNNENLASPSDFLFKQSGSYPKEDLGLDRLGNPPTKANFQNPWGNRNAPPVYSPKRRISLSDIIIGQDSFASTI